MIREIDAMIDSCLKDCQSIYFHKFKYECIYDIKLTKITKYEVINLTISGKSMNLYHLNKKLTVARQYASIFNQKSC